MAQLACRTLEKRSFLGTGGPAGVQVGDHRLHLSRVGGKGVVVNGHQLVWYDVIGKVQPKIAAVVLVPQVAHPHVPGVGGVAGDHLQVAPGLPGDVADPVGDACRHPYHIVRHDISCQQAVAYAARKDGPEGASLQYQSCFHAFFLRSGCCPD